MLSMAFSKLLKLMARVKWIGKLVTVLTACLIKLVLPGSRLFLASLMS